MRRNNTDPVPYFLVPEKPNAEANFKRCNYIIISMLGLLVLGLLMVAFVPEVHNTTSIGGKDNSKGRTVPTMFTEYCLHNV
jgi:hypothetical protein